MNIFKNGLRSADAFRCENGSGAHHFGGGARGGTLRLGRTALGGYVKITVSTAFAPFDVRLALSFMFKPNFIFYFLLIT